MNSRLLIGLIVLLQVLSAVFFAFDTFSGLIGIAPIGWQYRELIELAAAAGLLVGIYFGARVLSDALQRSREAEQRLRVASGAFSELLEERFAEWGLTPAERDVALFSIKGMSTAEIATLRNTSEGTVKAQTNAIYRKAEVTGRPQLLSHFIEDLMDGPLPGTEGERDEDQPAA